MDRNTTKFTCHVGQTITIDDHTTITVLAIKGEVVKLRINSADRRVMESLRTQQKTNS